MIGFGFQPRCPDCGSDVPKHADGTKRGLYGCLRCGTTHERDENGRLLMNMPSPRPDYEEADE